MASNPKRAKLMAEIAELQRLQFESIASATFGGWTSAEAITHDKRAEHLERLVRELDVLDGRKE